MIDGVETTIIITILYSITIIVMMVGVPNTI